jgi:hypothetical protein
MLGEQTSRAYDTIYKETTITPMKFVYCIQNNPCRVPGDVRSMSKERNQLCYLTRVTLYLNIKVYPDHVCTLKENVAQVSSF